MGGTIVRKPPAKLPSPALQQVRGRAGNRATLQRKQEVPPLPAGVLVSWQLALLPGRGGGWFGEGCMRKPFGCFISTAYRKRGLGRRLLGRLPPVGRPLSLPGRTGDFKPLLSARTTHGWGELWKPHCSGHTPDRLRPNPCGQAVASPFLKNGLDGSNMQPRSRTLELRSHLGGPVFQLWLSMWSLKQTCDSEMSVHRVTEGQGLNTQSFSSL